MIEKLDNENSLLKNELYLAQNETDLLKNLDFKKENY